MRDVAGHALQQTLSNTDGKDKADKRISQPEPVKPLLNLQDLLHALDRIRRDIGHIGNQLLHLLTRSWVKFDFELVDFSQKLWVFEHSVKSLAQHLNPISGHARRRKNRATDRRTAGVECQNVLGFLG